MNINNKKKIITFLKTKTTYLLNRPLNKPKFIELILTFKCNMRCPHCDTYKVKNKTELTTSDWKKIITQINNWLGPTDFCLSGGEPVIRKDCFEITKFIKDNNKKNNISILTNGYHDKITAKKIIESGISNIFISLYSLNETIHNEIKKTTFDYKKLCSFLDELILLRKKEKQKIKINLVFLLTAKNYLELPNFIKYFSMRGVYTSIRPIGDNPLKIFTNNYKSTIDNGLWINDIHKLQKVFENIKKNKKQNLINNYYHSFKHYINYFKEPKKFNYFNCYDPFRNFTIDPQGKVQSCYFSGQIGDLIKQKPQQIWLSKKRKQILKKMKNCSRNCRVYNNFNYLNLKLLK